MGFEKITCLKHRNENEIYDRTQINKIATTLFTELIMTNKKQNRRQNLKNLQQTGNRKPSILQEEIQKIVNP